MPSLYAAKSLSSIAREVQASLWALRRGTASDGKTFTLLLIGHLLLNVEKHLDPRLVESNLGFRAREIRGDPDQTGEANNWPQGFAGRFDAIAALIALSALLALFRYKVGVIPVIAVCGAAGFLLTFVKPWLDQSGFG